MMMMDESRFEVNMKYNVDPTPDESMAQNIISRRKPSTLTHIVRPDLDRLDQMIGKLQRCTNSSQTTCVSSPLNDTMNNSQNQSQSQHQSSVHRSHSSKTRAPPPPPPLAPPVISLSSSSNSDHFPSGMSSTLPETFISSLRQLFSILDKTNLGYVPFDVFKRYWTPSFAFGHSSPRLDILHELEIESKPNNYLITFDLLLNVIERSLTMSKHQSAGSPSPPVPPQPAGGVTAVTTTSESSLSSLSTPPIIVPKPTRPAPPISFPLNRSTSVVVVTPTPKKPDHHHHLLQQHQIPIVYRSYNSGMERNPPNHHEHLMSNGVRHRKKVVLQKNQKSNGNVYSEHPSIVTRRNTIHSNEIDFAMIRAMKRYEIERDLLVQTCDTLDRVKSYLIDRLFEMKEKQHSYSLQLSTAETTGIAPESMYNRDLVADLLKLANSVLVEANFESKKFSDRSSSSLSSSSMNGTNSHYQQQLKAKEDRIKHLETEKRVLLKELVEMRHQHRTVIPTKHC